MSTIKSLYATNQHEQWLLEISDGDTSILDFDKEYVALFEEFGESLKGTEHYLIEARLAADLNDSKLTKLFKAAAAVARGQPEQSSLIQDFRANALLTNIKNKIKKDIEQFKDVKPFDPVRFPDVVDSIRTKFKKTLGQKHDAHKLTKEIYRIGRSEPSKTVFIIRILSSLAGVSDKSYFPAIAVPALKAVRDSLK